eukprot:575546-Alexandrium_andersonii.AAC.1
MTAVDTPVPDTPRRKPRVSGAESGHERLERSSNRNPEESYDGDGADVIAGLRDMLVSYPVMDRMIENRK